MSANAVYSRDNKSAYVQIPELSDAYLMVNVDSLKDKIGSELSSQGVDLDSLFDSAEGADVDFDTDALEKDLEEYKKVIEDSFLSLLTVRKRPVTLTETSTAIQLRNTLSQAMM